MINYDDDELEWSIEEEDPGVEYMADYEYDMLDAEFYGEPNIQLKSAESYV